MAGKNSALRWFGVKTLFRTATQGAPRNVDPDYDETSELVEERIVICQAVDADAAIQQSEELAKQYAAELQYRNVYGQIVTRKYLGDCEAYEIEGEPLYEVYSATRLFRRDLSDGEIANVLLGPVETSERFVRKKFVRADIVESIVRMQEAGGPERSSPEEEN